MVSGLRVLVSVSLFAALCLPAVGAQCTNIYGGNVSGTWKASLSPYCIRGNIQVAGLTIQPGVRVVLDDNVRVDIGTSITAVGAPNNPIVFTARNPTVGWGGMHFSGLTLRSTLSFCRIEFSNSRGLNIINSTPTISYCDIQNNWSGGPGGGMMISLSTGSFSLTRCNIRNNRAGSHGGGIWCSIPKGSFTLLSCRVDGNQAITTGCGTRLGGGIYCPSAGQGLILKNCSITSNTCSAGKNTRRCDNHAQGGGLYVINNPLTLLNCIVRDNQAAAYHVNRFSNNKSTALGGATYFSGSSKALSMTNCIISCNQLVARTTKQGAAIYVASGQSTITNCTIARNTTPGGGIWLQSGKSTITSSIVYANSNPQIGGPAAGTACVTYSDVQGGFRGPCNPPPGNINMNVNPAFTGHSTSPTKGCLCQELAILPGSPVQNQGSKAPAANDKCFPPSLGPPPSKEPKNARNDMGATGGPGACGWRKWINWANPKLQLSAVPPRLPKQLPATVTFTARGGVVSTPIALFLVGYNGKAWNPPHGSMIPPVYTIFCPAGDWVLPLRIPNLTPKITSLWFRSISFNSFNLFLASPLVSNTIKM